MSCEMITPLFQLAITNYNSYTFFYLYSCLYFIQIDENCGLSIGVYCISWHTLPWILCITCLKTIGFISNFYLFFTPFFQSNPVIQSRQQIICLAWISGAFTIILAAIVLYRYRKIFELANELFKLEARREHTRL